MREIKFRAKSLGGELVYFTLYEVDNYFPSDGVFYVGGIPCIIGTEQEYTGLKDKNGKEIYEGDIVKTDEAGWIAQVIYNRDCFMCIGLDGKGFSCECSWENFEIIGNIYETQNY